MTFPVPARFNVSLARSEDVVCQIEAIGQGDLAAVLMRNLAISWGLHAVDALLLVLHVQEVRNFELWEWERVAKEVPAQDCLVGEELDCFGSSVAK